MQESQWVEGSDAVLRFNEYQNRDLNEVAEGIEKAVQRWDFKKEKFNRYRLCAFMSEDKKESSVRQNTNYY